MINFKTLSEDEKAAMHGKLREVKGTITHLLEHMHSDEIDPPLLTEIYSHMDEVEASLMQFHESVENSAFNWRRTRPFPETSLGERIPMRLLVPVCIDAFVVSLIKVASFLEMTNTIGRIPHRGDLLFGSSSWLHPRVRELSGDGFPWDGLEREGNKVHGLPAVLSLWSHPPSSPDHVQRLRVRLRVSIVFLKSYGQIGGCYRRGSHWCADCVCCIRVIWHRRASVSRM